MTSRKRGQIGSGGAGGSELFSTRQVARILGMPRRWVYARVRDGICRPQRAGRFYRFSFQDLVLLRTARGLFCSGADPRHVRRALRGLAARIPPDRSPSELRILVEDGRVVVREGRLSWHPETGQAVMPFVDGTPRRGARVVHLGTRGAPSDSRRREAAEQWFERALALEGEDPIGMEAAYRRAIEVDPSMTDAYINLGRLLYERGEWQEAVRLYRAALARAPDDPIAHYNLALALEDQGHIREAVRHYREAVRLEPHFADAHFNLARLLERLGERTQALRHFLAYKKLTDNY